MSFNTPHCTSSDVKDAVAEFKDKYNRVQKLQKDIALFEESRELFKRSEALRACATEGHAAPTKKTWLLFFSKQVCSRCGKPV